MICFHFTIFVVLETTFTVKSTGTQGLWFAFILLSLSYWKQPPGAVVIYCFSCDLLSFYYLCRTGNNGIVVGLRRYALWFAFILLSLSYWKQQGRAISHTFSCCDLLSFYYLCRTGNNFLLGGFQLGGVVICFHFTIFVVLETTPFVGFYTFTCCDLLSFYYLCRTGNNGIKGAIVDYLLWFAFILLSLSYWKQRTSIITLVNFGCDLLSFYYLCRTGNNCIKSSHASHSVVICFHFTIFVVLETTEFTLFVVFQHVIEIIGIQKMLFLIECNPADWRDYFFD